MLIITSGQWIEPTRAIGLIAYGTAFVCCSIKAVSLLSRRQAARFAAMLMLLEGSLLIDMAFNLRWRLHQTLMEVAIQKHEYGQRSLPQVIIVAVVAGLLLISVDVARRSLDRRGMRLIALSGAMVSAALWCIEVVSLHAMDQVLYYALFGVKAVSLIWIVSCTMTAIGILLDPS